MMRLVVHAGTHKTATTAFQQVCHANRKTLMAAGICYPEWEKRINHGFLALSLRQGDHAYIRKLMSRAVRHCRGNGTIPLSGEGLERCFVDVKMAFDLEDIARQSGVDVIEWVVVARKPFDYFQSLYAELSKQFLAMNYVEMAETILKHGFLSAACKYYDYMFVFDGPQFFAGFPAHRGTKLHVLSFEDFVRGYPGRVIFETTLARPDVARSITLPQKLDSNQSRSPREIELRYVCNFLGLSPEQAESPDFKIVTDQLIACRLDQIDGARAGLSKRFHKRFEKSVWSRLIPGRKSD